jgi:DivIVA domain-containing protein
MSELDVPLLPNAEQIRRRMFATVRRGFDPDQVRDYLGQVADQIENLEARLREASMAAEAAQAAQGAHSQKEPTDPYAEVAGRVAELLRSADRQAQSLVAEADSEARRLLDEARAEADRAKLDAQSRAEQAREAGEQALASAKREAEEMLSSLTQRREALVSDLGRVRKLLMSIAGQLSDAIPQPAGDEPAEEPGPEVLPEPAEEPRSPTPPATTREDVEVVDPRYEDLWASPDEVDLDLPDLPPLDDLEIDPGERERSPGDAR